MTGARVRKEDVASLVFFGEEATAGGDFHTALNFAGVTRAPVIALCVAPVGEAGGRLPSSASRGVAVKALAYGLCGERVDGSDVMAVLSVVREARLRASAGKGGTLVEAIVSRERDPLSRLRTHLEARGLMDEERDGRLAAEVAATVENARTAVEGKHTSPDSLFTGVYADVPWHLREQGRGLPVP
jgi:TPP-dependent pyruvate/acetoin dehydrogenase alpha subunit